MKICIIDYKAGNLQSVANAMRFIGAPAFISNDIKDIKSASHLIFPGVGNFGYAAASLQKDGLDGLLKNHIADGKPFLGICLGMQLLYNSSAESPGAAGLGIIEGSLTRFKDLKVPHMGWNTVRHNNCPLFKGLGQNPYMYFVHSFYVPAEYGAAGSTDYGIDFTSASQTGNTFGVQFHPEKSGDQGLELLKNFIKI